MVKGQQKTPSTPSSTNSASVYPCSVTMQLGNAPPPIPVTLPRKPYWEEEAAGGLFFGGGAIAGNARFRLQVVPRHSIFFAYAQAHEVRHRG